MKKYDSNETAGTNLRSIFVFPMAPGRTIYFGAITSAEEMRDKANVSTISLTLHPERFFLKLVDSTTFHSLYLWLHLLQPLLSAAVTGHIR